MLLPAWLFFCLAAFLVEGSMMCVLLAQPILAIARWGAGPEQLGFLGLLSGGCYAAMALVAGWGLGRGLPSRPAMALGVGSQAALALIEPHCTTLAGFMGAIAAQMMLLGFFWTAFQKTLAETYSASMLPRALGRFNLSWSSGATIGVWISGRLFERVSPSAPFIAGAAGLGAALLIVVLARPRVPDGDGLALPKPALAQAGAVRFVHRAWTGMWICSFVAGTLINLFPLLARAPQYSLGPAGISNLHTLRQGAMFAGFIVAGATAHWRFRNYPLHLCLGLIVASLAALTMAPSALWLAPPFAAIGLATGLAFAFSVYYSLYLPETRATRVGVHEAMLSTAMALGPVIGGKIGALTENARAPYVACLAAAAAAWLALAARDWYRRIG